MRGLQASFPMLEHTKPIRLLPSIQVSAALLPVSQSVDTHGPKSTELLNFDVFGSGTL